MEIGLSLLLLVIAASVAAVSKNDKIIKISSVVTAVFIFLMVGFLSWTVVSGDFELPSRIWHLDPFAAILLFLVAAVYLLASFVSHRYLGHEFEHKILSLNQVKLYYFLLPLFVLTMLAAVAADNIGVMWIALEGTTLTTTLLVALYRKEASIEAAWKYVIICSLGIGLGLLGVLMFFYAAVSDGLTPEQALSLRELLSNAKLFDPAIVKWAFVFIFIGLGTKVGLVPMHTWLPDAHSKTPSPISAMLSGTLLNVALYCVLRFKTVTDLTLASSEFTSRLFLAFGTISVVLAALIMLQARNYKRTLAYSSIEHMGLITFAFGLGPIGMAPALIHLVGHTFIKSMLFFTAGEIFLLTNTTKIEGALGLMKRIPVVASLFLIGIAAILALPPSPLFFSELLMFSSSITAHPIYTGLILVALVIAALGMFRTATRMIFSENPSVTKPIRDYNPAVMVIIFQIILISGIGLSLLNPGIFGFFVNFSTKLLA